MKETQKFTKKQIAILFNDRSIKRQTIKLAELSSHETVKLSCFGERINHNVFSKQ